jgi:hypothetical protein
MLYQALGISSSASTNFVCGNSPHLRVDETRDERGNEE